MPTEATTSTPTRPAATRRRSGPAIVLALLLTATVIPIACGGKGRKGKGGRATRGGGSQPGQAFTRVPGAATLDTRPVLKRFAKLLLHERPPLKLHPRAAKDAEGGPISMLVREQVSLAFVGRPPSAAEKRLMAAARPRPHALVLGGDTVAVLANTTNPADRILVADLGRILRGEVTDWRQIRGPRLPLTCFLLAPPSDLTRRLRQVLIEGDRVGLLIRQVPDVATLLESVRREPGGIGLLALYQVNDGVGPNRDEGLKLLALLSKIGAPGYLATDRAAALKDGYPLLAPVVLVTRPEHFNPKHALGKLLGPRLRGYLGSRLGLVPLPEDDAQRLATAWNR